MLSHARDEFCSQAQKFKVKLDDVGIKLCAKNKNCCSLLFRAFDNVNIDSKSIYNMKVLAAMCCTCEEQDWCLSTVIENCFSYCLNVGVEVAESEIRTEKEETLKGMKRDATKHNVHFTRANLNGLFCLADEDGLTKSFKMHSVADSIARLRISRRAKTDASIAMVVSTVFLQIRN